MASGADDEHFWKKSDYYQKLFEKARERCRIDIDINGDGYDNGYGAGVVQLGNPTFNPNSPIITYGNDPVDGHADPAVVTNAYYVSPTYRPGDGVTGDAGARQEHVPSTRRQAAGVGFDRRRHALHPVLKVRLAYHNGPYPHEGVRRAAELGALALVDPGDEVVFPVPYWVSYPDMTRLAGGVPVPVKAGDGSILPTLEEMTAAITDRTRAVLLNSPNNPSGQVYDEGFLRGMVRLCEERNVFLMMDDIYHRLVFDGVPLIHCYDCTDREVDDTRIVVLNGVSKQYAMTGFRIGWAVGPRELIQAMSNIQSHQSGGPCTLSQTAAVAAIGGAQGSVGSLRKALETHRDEMVALLREIPGLKVPKPGGTFYCFCDFRAFDEDCTRLSEFLLDKVQVVTVPGVEFGLPGFLRLSYCGSLADIHEGVRRIKWALDPNGPQELTIGDRVIRR